VIFVPFFTIVFPLLGHRLEPVQAVEVGLLTEIVGFMSSTSAFWRAGLIDFRIAGFALAFAVPTAVIGGISAHFLPAWWLLVVVGVGLILFAFMIIRETGESGAHKGRAAETEEHTDRLGRTYRYRRQNDRWRAGTAAVGGVFQGLVGFSAGEMSTVEQVLRGIPVRLAAGNAHMIIAAASISAAITHLTMDATTGATIPWNILAATAPAVLIGGQIASFIAGRMPQATLRLVLSCFLALVGVISFYRASLAPQLGWPPWIVLVILVLVVAALVWLLLQQRSSPCTRAGGACCSASTSANPNNESESQ
jgi:hypothetical protein